MAIGAVIATGVVAFGITQNPDLSKAETNARSEAGGASSTPTAHATEPAALNGEASAPTTTQTAPSAPSALSAPTTAAAPGAAVPEPVPTTMPVGDVTSNGRTWKQAYTEDFTRNASLGTVLSTYPALAAYSGYHDTSGRGLYAPDKVLSVSNGNLDFWLHSENGQSLVATVLPDDYAPHTTGRVSIRYKTTDAVGYKFVGMFWPCSDDWNEGEIDWPEGPLNGTVRPASAIPGSLHNGSMAFDRSVQQPTAEKQSSGYHVATTEWDHGVIRFYWDDVLVSSTRTAVPTTPMRVTLQAETAVHGSVPLSSSGHVEIDWISIWN